MVDKKLDTNANLEISIENLGYITDSDNGKGDCQGDIQGLAGRVINLKPYGSKATLILKGVPVEPKLPPFAKEE